MGKNMNRLRAGAVLDVPEVQSLRSVTPAEARTVIRAQSKDFNLYRQTLAGAVAPVTDGPGFQVLGRQGRSPGG